MGSKYTKADHERAFQLYRELGSFYAVSQQPGMPSHQTLLRWASPECDDWEGLEKKIRAKVREKAKGTDGQNGQNLSEEEQVLDRYVRSDLDKLRINMAIEAVALKAIKDGIVEPPSTLSEIQKILYEAWREQRLITGEPESIREVRGPLIIMMGEDNEDEGDEG